MALELIEDGSSGRVSGAGTDLKPTLSILAVSTQYPQALGFRPHYRPF